jgi:hypothetical protein
MALFQHWKLGGGGGGVNLWKINGQNFEENFLKT